MDINKKLSLLREKLEENKLEGYLITGTDYNQSEYVSAYFRSREFISGFTGSAGTVLVTKNKAYLWVDSRYYIQGAKQIENSEFILMKLDFESTLNPYDFIENTFLKGAKLGVDGKTISIAQFKELSTRFAKKQISFEATPDLLDSFWTDRPAFPFSKCEDFALEYAGVSRKIKLDMIRHQLAKKGTNATLIASLDDIAWALNLRANDIPHSPVFVAYLLVTLDEAILFINPKRFNEGLKAEVEKVCKIADYDAIYEQLDSNTLKFYYDDNKVNQSFAKYFNCDSVLGMDFSTLAKAQKNEAELEGMRKAHYFDGIAYANFRAKLKNKTNLDEIAVSTLFEEERQKMPGYLEPSFGPISGFGPHGAMCHYSATKETSSLIDSDNLLVLDTGSQYEYGTTDLTRTLLFGKATEAQKRDYTIVLKGHLALGSCWFIEGTYGPQLDILAKQYLWQAGMSFYHGTGHGVGCRLNVHEGPCSISTRVNKEPLKVGMVLSNEPGLYKEGEYGIRIENLIAVQRAAKTQFGQFLSFETLSMVPYERELIDLSLLSDIELKQINSYHKWIFESFKDKVEKETLVWLQEATAILEK